MAKSRPLFVYFHHFVNMYNDKYKYLDYKWKRQ